MTDHKRHHHSLHVHRSIPVMGLTQERAEWCHDTHSWAHPRTHALFHVVFPIFAKSWCQMQRTHWLAVTVAPTYNIPTGPAVMFLCFSFLSMSCFNWLYLTECLPSISMGFYGYSSNLSHVYAHWKLHEGISHCMNTTWDGEHFRRGHSLQCLSFVQGWPMVSV